MVRFAHAVLRSEGLYVMQHRDDKPGIAAPGMWALFGGRVLDHESPRDAVIREVDEELCVRIDNCEPVWVVDRYSEFAKAIGTYSFFQADISSQWGRHRLMEGQAVARFSFDELAGLPMFPIMREALALHHGGLDTGK